MASEGLARKRRRWRVIALALVLLAPVVLAALMPVWLSSGAGRRWLLARANRALAPGGLDASSFHFSWFGPTRIHGLVLIDHEREHVIDAPRARWDRNLWQILTDRPRFGT